MKLFVLGFPFRLQTSRPVASRYGIDTTNRSRKELNLGKSEQQCRRSFHQRGIRGFWQGFLSVCCPPNRKKTQPRRGSGWNRYHARRQYINFRRWLSMSNPAKEHAKACLLSGLSAEPVTWPSGLIVTDQIRPLRKSLSASSRPWVLFFMLMKRRHLRQGRLVETREAHPVLEQLVSQEMGPPARLLTCRPCCVSCRWLC